MAKNVIIGIGNAGSCCVKAITASPLLSDTRLYALDSVLTQLDRDTINRVTVIPISADERSGSGRNRTRGAEMYKYHEQNGLFNDMYDVCEQSGLPVIVITSSAGGTGSGSCPELCATLVSKGIQVIPIIICPNEKDPDAFHLNTNDLFMELGAIKDKNGDPGIRSYTIFENTRGDADYDPVNSSVVELIEIILGKRYDNTDRDTIDDSDLDTILDTPGRFIAVSAKSNSAQGLKRELMRNVFSGFQPAWTEDDSKERTIVVAYSLKSMFADKEYKEIFGEIVDRLDHVYDEYRNIKNDDNGGLYEGSIIVTGLSRPNVKEIYTEYQDVSSISSGITTSKRPGFMGRKKASVREVVNEKGTKEKHFKWD